MTSKIPANVTASTKAKCAEVVAKFPKITHVYGYAGAPSDHQNHRCIDFMVYNSELPASKNLSQADRIKLGDAIVAYLVKHARRLGVNGLIWRRRVMGFPHADNPPYRGPWGKWRDYHGRNPHTDHVHVEFDASRFTPLPAPKPAPTTYAFWVAQLNIQNPDYASTKATALPWSQRLPKLVDLLKRAKCSVLILNECDRDEAAQIQARIGSGWVWDRYGTNVVMVDGAKWDDRRLIEKYLAGPTSGYRRTLVAREYQRKGTGAPTVLIGSTHLEALASGFVKSEAAADKLRADQAHEVDRAMTQTRTILGADVNDTSDDSGPRAILRAGGLLPLGDRVKVANLDGRGTGPGRRHLDDLFTSRDLKVTEAEVIEGGQASDHNLTRARIEAPRR